LPVGVVTQGALNREFVDGPEKKFLKKHLV